MICTNFGDIISGFSPYNNTNFLAKEIPDNINDRCLISTILIASERATHNGVGWN